MIAEKTNYDNLILNGSNIDHCTIAASAPRHKNDSKACCFDTLCQNCYNRPRVERYDRTPVLKQIERKFESSGTVLQRLFAYAILVITLLWLVLNYIPASIVKIPQITYPPESDGRLFSYLLAGGVVLFVLLQVWLVVASLRMFRTADGTENITARRFGLTQGTEAFWTAIPLLMTIGLAVVVWQIWPG